MAIQAVTFDVGGTLIEPHPSVGHVYAAVAAEHGFDGLSADLLNARFKAAWRACSGFDYTRMGWAALVEETFSGLIQGSPSQTFFDSLYDRFSEPAAWKVFDDVVPTLEVLASRDVPIGIISNWDERLRGLLERFRLMDFFDAVVISCEAGFVKPSPVIFEQAAIKLGSPAAAILHVGDSAEHDVAGARGAGFQAVHLRRNRPSSSAEIGSLREILPLITRVN